MRPTVIVLTRGPLKRPVAGLYSNALVAPAPAHLRHHRRRQIGIVREQRECARQAGVRRQPVEFVVGLRIQRISVDRPALRNLDIPRAGSPNSACSRGTKLKYWPCSSSMPPPTIVALLRSRPNGKAITPPLPTKVWPRSAVAPPVIRPPDDMAEDRIGPSTMRVGQDDRRLRHRAVGDVGPAVGVGAVGVIVDPVVVEILDRRDEVAALARKRHAVGQ